MPQSNFDFYYQSADADILNMAILTLNQWNASEDEQLQAFKVITNVVNDSSANGKLLSFR
jgi:hypothetical protein